MRKLTLASIPVRTWWLLASCTLAGQLGAGCAVECRTDDDSTAPVFPGWAWLDAGRARVDAGRPDAGLPDAGLPDAARPDAAQPDAAVLDAGLPDAGDADAAVPDAGNPDAGARDASVPDGSGTQGDPEDGGPDAGTPDAGPWPAECMQCHGGNNNPAPPRDTAGGTAVNLRGVGAHRAHLRTTPMFRAGECANCHVVPTLDTMMEHVDTVPAELTWSPLAGAKNVSPAFDGVTCTVYCHGVTLRGGSVTKPAWTVKSPPQAYCGSCHGAPPPGHAGTLAAGCSGCHPWDGLTPKDPAQHIDGVLQVEGGGCGGCHALPPPTPGHQTHAAGALPDYGGLGTALDQPGVQGYALGCGQCHPLDGSAHMNGTTDIEFYNPAAPPGTWKARHPASARYTPGDTESTDDTGLHYTNGTCSNVACHGGLTTLAPSVPAPVLDFPWEGYPVVYPPYAVERVPFYRPAVWGGTLSCGGCHDYPPRTDAATTVGGAGSNHASLDVEGFEDGHIFNHGNEPVPCRACHLDTVQEKGSWSRNDQDITTLEDVPVNGFAFHVNGQSDVRLNNAEVVMLFGKPFALDGATYDPGTKTCSNVACHLTQTSVVWGTPYRFQNWVECDNCHHY